MIARRIEHWVGHIRRLRLEFLQANNVSILLLESFKKSLSGSRANTVQVESNYPHKISASRFEVHHYNDASTALPVISIMFKFRQDFIRFAVQQKVLSFGEFQTKAGRLSPYFFNAGLFNDGASLRSLSQFYAQAILASEIPFDMLFGPAYKGIPLVAGTAIALAEQGNNVPYCYNRKEAKDHGEGGTTVGAKLQGRVLIIDDVISAGTSVRESIGLIRSAGAEPCGVVIALDRMERGQGELSAVQEVQRNYNIPVAPIATLNDLLGYLRDEDDLVQNLHATQLYRDKYGVTNG